MGIVRKFCIAIQAMVFLYSYQTYGQNFSMFTNNGQTITTCKATISSNINCDDGSGVPSYCNNENQTVTFYSGSSSKQLRISFPSNSFFTENDFDVLKIYNAANTSGTLLATLSGYLTTPFSYTSTNGYLTLQFSSDALFNDWGFKALIGCELQNCNGNIPAGDECNTAPQICDLNEYCGTTTGWFTPDKYNILGSDFGGVFCGSIENNSWLKFIANATQANLIVNSGNCLNAAAGIEAQIFKSNNCNSFTSVSNCVSQNSGSGQFLLTTNNNLVPGQTYYVMIDGYNGNQCDYTIQAQSGIKAITLNSSKDTICPPQTSKINISGTASGTTYAWSPTGSIIGSTNSDTVRVKPSITTTYTCIITLPNGCNIQTEKYTIYVTPPPTANAGADKILTCISPQATLEGSSNSTDVKFIWTSNSGGIISDTNLAIVDVNKIGNYILTVVDTLLGCSNSDVAKVTSQIFNPNVNAGTNVQLTCAQPEATLNGTSTVPNAEYVWYGPGLITRADTATPQANIAGKYILEVTDPISGCKNEDSVFVTLSNTLPDVDAGIDTSLSCKFSQIRLIGTTTSSGITITWTGPGIVSGGNTLTPLINAAGTYNLSIMYNSNGCTSQDIVIVKDNTSSPIADAGTDKILNCSTPSGIRIGPSVFTSGFTYNWSILGYGNLSSLTVFNPIARDSGIYVLKFTNNITGCFDYDTVLVSKNVSLPDVEAGMDITIPCTNSSAKLDANSSIVGAKYAWSGPGIIYYSTTDTPTITIAGLYKVTVTNPLNSCKNTDSINVFQSSDLPDVNAGVMVQLNCKNPTDTLLGFTSTPKSTFVWTGPPNGIVSGANTLSPIIKFGGIYNLTVTDSLGCKNSDTVLVISDFALPNVDAGSDVILTCIKNIDTLKGSSTTSGVIFQWTGPGNIINPTSAYAVIDTVGKFKLTVTKSSSGCARTDSVTVTENKILPNVNAGNDIKLNCFKQTDTLKGNSSSTNVSFSWIGASFVSGQNTAKPIVDAGGNYILTVTNNVTKCKKSDTAFVLMDTLPPDVDAGLNGNIDCNSPTTTLRGNSTNPYSKYLWSGDYIISLPNRDSIIVSNSGKYYLTVQDTSNGCIQTDSVLVTKSTNIPTISAGIDTSISCFHPTPSLSGTSTSNHTQYLWSGIGIISNPNAITINVNTAGTYTLTVTDTTNGCSAIDQAVVEWDNANPDANAGVDKIITCIANIIQLNGSSISSNVNFQWTGGTIISGANTETPIISSAGNFIFTVQDTLNGCISKDTAIVTLSDILPNIFAGNDTTLNCRDTSLILNGISTSIGAKYSWTGPGIVKGATSSKPEINKPGEYILKVTTLSNGCSSFDTLKVFIDTIRPDIYAGNDTLLDCFFPTINLYAQSSIINGAYSWIGPGIISGYNTNTPSINKNGVYSVNFTNNNNHCHAKDSVFVAIDTLTPLISAGTNKILNCRDTIIRLEGISSTPNTKYLWSGSGIVGDNSVLTPSVNTADTYILTSTSLDNGCIASDTVLVSIDTIHPHINAGISDTLTCRDTLLVLSGSSSTPNVSFAWTGASIVSGQFTRNPTINIPDTYVLAVTDTSNYCVSYDSVVVALNISPPTIAISTPPTLTCANPSVQLQGNSATPLVSYAWTGPGIVRDAVTDTPTVNLPGWYFLTVTDVLNGCTSLDSVLVNIQVGIPNVNAGPSDTLTCTQTSIVLSGSSATSNVSYSWTGGSILSGANTTTPTVNAVAYYVFTVTDTTNGCIAKDSVFVAIDTLTPLISAGTNKILNCRDTIIRLEGISSTPNTKYLWSGSGIVGDNSVLTPSVNTADTYILTSTSLDNGCIASDTVLVSIDTIHPHINAGISDTLTCRDTLLVLSGSSSTPNVSFAWTGASIVSGQFTRNPTINIPDTYVLAVTDTSNYCVSYDSVVVALNISPPTIAISTPPTLTCANPSVQLQGNSATPLVSYAWTGPGIVRDAVTDTPTVNLPGWYFLTVTDVLNGCTSLDSVLVNIQVGIPNVNAGPSDTLTCTQTSIVLSGSSATSNVSYSWTGGSILSGANTTTPTVNAVAYYVLTVTDTTNGCIAKDSVFVAIDTLTPLISAGDNKTLNCRDMLIRLEGISSTPNTKYLWSGSGIVGDNSVLTPSVNTADTYILTSTSLDNGCIASDTVLVSIDTIHPHINAGISDTLTCRDTLLVLSGSSSTPNVSFAWTGASIVSGQFTRNPTINIPDTYVLAVTDTSNYCVSYDSVVVALNISPPTIAISTPPTLTCANPSVQLQGNSATPLVSYAWTGPGIVRDAVTDTPTVNLPGWYFLTVIDVLNGCTSLDSVLLNIDTIKPGIIVSVDKNPVCPDEKANFIATDNLSSYVWHLNNLAILGDNSNVFEASKSGIYFVKAAAINGCIGMSNAIELIHLPKPNIEVQALSNRNICEGDSIKIYTDSGFSKYSWWFENAIFKFTTQNYTYVKDSGFYQVSVTNDAGCSDTSNQISIHTDKDFEINFGEDVSICKNKYITLDPGVSNADSYLWNTAEITPTISVQNIGNYSVSISRGSCKHDGSIFVTYAGDIPDFTFGEDIIGCLKRNVILNAPENYAYVWGDSSNDAKKYIEEPGIYTIAVSNKCGTIYDTIAVTFDTCDCDVYIPNAFSPNANSLNDYFTPINACNTTYILQVYNRWGTEIYKGSNTDLGWDGTYQNEWQPQDSYIYILSYFDRFKKTTQQQKGVFILIR